MIKGEAGSIKKSNLVWRDGVRGCYLFHILTLIKDVNLMEKDKEAMSAKVKN